MPPRLPRRCRSRQPVPRFSNDELKIERRNFIEMHDTRRAAHVAHERGRRRSDRSLTGNVQNLPKTVGGGCLHADLKMPRFEPTDFQLGTLLATFPARRSPTGRCSTTSSSRSTRGASGCSACRARRARTRSRARARTRLSDAAGRRRCTARPSSARASSTLGYTMFPYPTAVNSMPYDGRPACVTAGSARAIRARSTRRARPR